MLICKRIFALLIVFIVCSTSVFASAKEPKGGLLWKISGNGMTEPSYLFGTWHGTYDILSGYLDSIPGFYRAFDACSQYVGEVGDLENIQSYISKLDIKMPQDTTYSDLFDESEMKFMDSVLIRRMNVPLKEMNLKPGFLGLVLDEIKKQEKLKRAGFTHAQIDSMAKQTIDIVLSVKAKEKGYFVTGLETVEQQTDMLFNSGDLKKEAKQLLKNLRDTTFQKMGEEIIDELHIAYRSQNIQQIAQVELKFEVLCQQDAEMKEMHKDFKEEMLSQRNSAWAEKIPTIIKETPTFIGVGVRHLSGETGVIRLLQEKGYKVEAVK